jgi:conjugative transfer signal peptidase TraF
LLVLACATLAALSFEPHFLVYNRTASLPRGWYWLSYQKPITRGALILACPPPAPLARIVAAGNPFEPGACPGGYAPLIKVVVGLPGDHIRVLEQGVSINGRIIAHSRPITGLPRPLPLTLPSDEVWGWSPVRGSIDSRYLGPLRPVAVARPLVSFNERERDALVIRFTN